MNIDKTTPRPWKILEDLEIVADRPDDNATIAMVYQCGGIREIDEAGANAMLIVTAVNAYDPRKDEALKDALAALDGLGWHSQNLVDICWCHVKSEYLGSHTDKCLAARTALSLASEVMGGQGMSDLPCGPCPKCGSVNVSFHRSPCICKCLPYCWQFPQCDDCGFTNGGQSANSPGDSWEKFEPTPGGIRFYR